MNAVTPTPTEELLATVSASRLNLWHQCRLKFFFRYVLKLEKPKTPALHVGTTVHSVLQAWNMARWRKEPFQITTMRQVFDAGWKEQLGVKWDDDEAKQQQQAWQMAGQFRVTRVLQRGHATRINRLNQRFLGGQGNVLIVLRVVPPERPPHFFGQRYTAGRPNHGMWCFLKLAPILAAHPTTEIGQFESRWWTGGPCL
jgi:PD-(D/E)XK nuclease superfamily